MGAFIPDRDAESKAIDPTIFWPIGGNCLSNQGLTLSPLISRHLIQERQRKRGESLILPQIGEEQPVSFNGNNFKSPKNYLKVGLSPALILSGIEGRFRTINSNLQPAIIYPHYVQQQSIVPELQPENPTPLTKEQAHKKQERE